MFKRLCDGICKPNVHLASLVLRVGLAVIFIYHGYLKITILQGGSNWDNKLDVTTQVAVAWGETICGCALLVGFLSRLAALGIIVLQVGAITLYTSKYDFVNIEYNPKDQYRIATGTEYNFALIVLSLAVLVLGSGMLSIDRCLFGGRRRKAPTA